MREISALVNRHTQSNWLGASSPLYRLESGGKVMVSLESEPLAGGQIALRFSVRNTGSVQAGVKVSFPVLRGLKPDKGSGELAYCFPKSGSIIGSDPIDIRRHYGGLFPLQFLDVYRRGAGGIYLICRDRANNRKTFHLRKARDGSADMSVEYPKRILSAGESWTLPPAVLGAHAGDWHAALQAYRRWVDTWYRPAAPRKKWFREAFNLRQVFLHPNLGLKYGAFDPKTEKFSLARMVKDDVSAFGGVDFVHIFDWSHTFAHGRVGQYRPWNDLGGAPAFRKEISKIQAIGIPVGAYLEGYLVSKNADVAAAKGALWQMLGADRKPHRRFGAGYCYMCPQVSVWRDYLAAACKGVVDSAGVDGVYLDQFGFGYQYPCHRADHGHSSPANQLQSEASLIARVRKSVGPNKVIYVEETPTDVTTQLLDGSFSYALSNDKAIVNLTRFAIPDFKVFHIIRCDQPLGNDLDAVCRIFFNGDGIWLEGPLSIAKWFPPKVRKLIAKTHRLLRTHRDAFCSTDVTPLVPTRNKSLLANRFATGEKVVWTLYNRSDKPLSGEFLAIARTGESRYHDAWNDKPLKARSFGGEDIIRIEMPAGGYGCVVQYRMPRRLRRD
ncbi:MAG: DUF6259 domain-containing protein [Phycisphaerae bacterium]|nr:DUF6259 domain-containing protein [Phycisphaerae bacterium]